MTLSYRHGQHLFDTLYHALALRTPGAVFVTTDSRDARHVTSEGSIVLLRDWARRG